MSSPLLKSKENYSREYLDKGAYGTVFKITSKLDGTVYALKSFDFEKLSDDDIKLHYSDAKKEYEVLRIGIENVIKCYGSHFDEKTKNFVFSMDLMDQTLMKLIRKNGSLSFEEFIPIFKDFSKGFFFEILLKISIKFRNLGSFQPKGTNFTQGLETRKYTFGC
jgi:hypothetical protein